VNNNSDTQFDIIFVVEPGNETFTSSIFKSRTSFADTTVNMKFGNSSPYFRLTIKELECLRSTLFLELQGICLKDCTFDSCFGANWQGMELDNVVFKGDTRGQIHVRTSLTEAGTENPIWPTRIAQFHDSVEIALDLTEAKFDHYPGFDGFPAEKIRRGEGQFVFAFDDLRDVARADYPKSFAADILRSTVLFHNVWPGYLNKTAVFIAPLIAEDGPSQLADCVELEKLGFLRS
jgi:hypothetical protein